MEAISEREFIIKLDGKLDATVQTMERIANTLERLENVKFEEHNGRIASLEKFKYQIMGAVAILVSLDVIINIIRYFAGNK